MNNKTFTSYFGELPNIVHFSYKIANMEGQNLEWERQRTYCGQNDLSNVIPLLLILVHTILFT